jgi:nucleotide-binding universal stress UspA family protein
MTIEPLRHILVTTDLSSAAEPALIAAASLARDLSARLTLLHVLNAGSLAGASPVREEVQRLKTEWREEVAPQLEILAKRLLDGVPHELAIVEAAAVASGICTFASEHGVDLLVIATHGRTGIRRWMLGSVAEAVLRKAPCEVLAVRSEVQGNPLETLHRILVPTDFSECSGVALDRAVETARCHSAEIHLLHSYELAVPLALGAAAGQPLGLDEEAERLRSHAQRLLQSLKGKVEAQGVPVRTYLSPDGPVQAIVDAAKELRADLIVMGTHGRSGFRRLLVGSVVDPVVRMAPCAVLTVRTCDTAAEAAEASGSAAA